MKSNQSMIRLLLAGFSLALVAQGHAATVIGLNFARDGGGTTTGNADGVLLANWTDVFDSDGFGNSQNKVLNGSGGAITTSWYASNSWWAGSNANAERRIYACYLDDHGTGVSVTITGLSSWLATEGMPSYQIRAYASTDTGEGTFHPVTVHLGDATGATLDTIARPVLGDGDFPDGPFDTTATPRGYGDSIGTLTADTITLTIPPLSGTTRGTLAALSITAIPEPATALLSLLGSVALVARRRRR